MSIRGLKSATKDVDGVVKDPEESGYLVKSMMSCVLAYGPVSGLVVRH